MGLGAPENLAMRTVAGFEGQIEVGGTERAKYFGGRYSGKRMGESSEIAGVLT